VVSANHAWIDVTDHAPVVTVSLTLASEINPCTGLDAALVGIVHARRDDGACWVQFLHPREGLAQHVLGDPQLGRASLQVVDDRATAMRVAHTHHL